MNTISLPLKIELYQQLEVFDIIENPNIAPHQQGFVRYHPNQQLAYFVPPPIHIGSNHPLTQHYFQFCGLLQKNIYQWIHQGKLVPPTDTQLKLGAQFFYSMQALDVITQLSQHFIKPETSKRIPGFTTDILLPADLVTMLEKTPFIQKKGEQFCLILPNLNTLRNNTNLSIAFQKFGRDLLLALRNYRQQHENHEVKLGKLTLTELSQKVLELLENNKKFAKLSTALSVANQLGISLDKLQNFSQDYPTVEIQEEEDYWDDKATLVINSDPTSKQTTIKFTIKTAGYFDTSTWEAGVWQIALDQLGNPLKISFIPDQNEEVYTQNSLDVLTDAAWQTKTGQLISKPNRLKRFKENFVSYTKGMLALDQTSQHYFAYLTELLENLGKNETYSYQQYLFDLSDDVLNQVKLAKANPK